MKITMSFSPEEISEARRVLDLLSAAEPSSLAPPPPAPPPPSATAPPAPPPPSATAPPAPPPPSATTPPPAPPPPSATVPPAGAPPAGAPPAGAPPAGAPPAGAPPLAVVPEVDKAGNPWDERFHAKSKKKIKDGTWRRKKGVTQKDVDAAFADSPAASPPLGVVPPTPPLSPVPPVADGAVTWESVVEAFQSRASKYTQEQIQAALRSAVIEPTTLHANPDQYSAAIAALNAQCPM